MAGNFLLISLRFASGGAFDQLRGGSCNRFRFGADFRVVFISCSVYFSLFINSLLYVVDLFVSILLHLFVSPLHTCVHFFFLLN